MIQTLTNLSQCFNSRMMVNTLKLMLVGVALIQDLAMAKHYIIETGDQAGEFGTDYGAPVPYGGGGTQEYVPPTTTMPTTRQYITCRWGPYDASSKWQGPCGGTSTETRSRSCVCSDGSRGSSAMCGGGHASETKTIQNPPCEQEQTTVTPKPNNYAPKPYRHRNRRHKKRQ